MNHYLKPLVSFLLPRQNICEEYPKKAKTISNLFHIHKNKNRIMKKEKEKEKRKLWIRSYKKKDWEDSVLLLIIFSCQIQRFYVPTQYPRGTSLPQIWKFPRAACTSWSSCLSADHISSGHKSSKFTSTSALPFRHLIQLSRVK